MEYAQAIEKLKLLAKAENTAGMARFGINPQNTLGVSIPVLRMLAKKMGKNHRLAGKLWKSGFHEARILAALVDEPEQVTARQMDGWAKDFDSWDVCDQVCSNLFDKTLFAYEKVAEWSESKEEFVKRAGFVLMAALAVHDKKALDGKFERFFPLIRREALDGRNFVKKAVNWALRQLGKRNAALRRKAIQEAEKILKIDSPSAKWIARDALRELKIKR